MTGTIVGSVIGGITGGLFAPRPTANFQQPERDNTALYITGATVIVILIIIVIILRKK